MGNYRDIFSLVTAIQKNCEAFSWSFPENPEKHLFSIFLRSRGYFFAVKFEIFSVCPPKRSSADLKTAKKQPYFAVFQPKTQFFFSLKLPLSCFKTLCIQLPIGWLPFDFERPWSDTVSFRNVLVRTWKPQNTTFSHFLAQNPILAAKSCLFRFWYTSYTKVGSYPVNLSLTGAIQWNCEMFSRSFPENPRKPVFYTFFRSRG